MLDVLSRYAKAVLRATGVGTNSQGPAIQTDAQLSGLLDELDAELSRLMGIADKLHESWFTQMADKQIDATEGAYLKLGQPSADRLMGALKAFSRSGFEDVHNASRQAWLDEFRRVGAQLQDELKTEMVKALQDGIGQQDLANRISTNPLFRFENLPNPESAKRIYGSARLGELEALDRRANVIARDAISEASNRLHEKWTQEAGFTLYKNYNPLDGRTTDGCAEASKHAPMTLEQWDRWRAKSDNQGGRPPRLPLCRSQLIAVA